MVFTPPRPNIAPAKTSIGPTPPPPRLQPTSAGVSSFAFTMTAAFRPEIISRTVESFKRFITDVNLRSIPIYVNLDPVPRLDSKNDIVRILREYFGRVIINYPQTPSFPAAVKWCFSQPREEYVFHLEDDWELLEPISLENLANLLDADDRISCVNLRMYAFASDDTRICLSPGLWRGDHMRAIAKRLSIDFNPEKQLRPATVSNPGGDRHVGFRGQQWPFDPARRIIRDLGRAWLANTEWRKEIPITFTKWVKR